MKLVHEVESWCMALPPSPYIQVNLYTYVCLEMSLGAMINFIVVDENGRGFGCKHHP